MTEATIAGGDADLRRHLAAGDPPGIVADLVLGEIVGLPAIERRASIYPLLRRRLDQHATGASGALAPSAELDQALRRLVALITRRFGGDRFHVEVVTQVMDRLASDRSLLVRATAVRRAAAAAEEAMEHHYCRLVTRELDGGRRPGAAARPPAPSPGRAADRAQRLGVLRAVLGRFPYTRNYELLTRAELAALQATGSAIRSVVFCGAGPLPLTGILLHVLTGATVTLVEIGVEAAALASRLIEHLTGLGVVEHDSIDVVLADAASADLGHVDLVIVASLVDQAAMLQLADRLARQRAASRMLMVRSAAGLVSQFAYEAIPVRAVTSLGYRHVGEVTPLSAVTLIPTVADRSVAVAMGSPGLLAVAPRQVLNRTELFALPA